MLKYFFCRWYLFIAVFSAVLLHASYTPFLILPLIPLSLYLISRALSCSVKYWHSVLISFVFGYTYCLLGLYWIFPLLVADAENFAWMIPWVFLGILALAIPYGAMGFCSHFFRHKLWTQRAAIAASFSTIEWIQTHYFVPWNFVGGALAFSEPLLQITSVLGIWGAGVFLLISALLFTFPYRNTWCAGFLLVFISYCFGFNKLNKPLGTNYSAPIRIVQPNISKNEIAQANDAQKLSNLTSMIDLSFVDDERTIIIWPETALPFAVSSQSIWLNVLSPIVPKNGGLIFGADRIENFPINKRWNSLFILNSDGGIDSYYDKVNLVPFGEYVPFSSFFSFFSPIATQGFDLQTGEGAKTLRARAKNVPAFSPLICYDVLFSNNVINPFDQPLWMLAVVNDGWFAGTTEPSQSLLHSRLRAIEYGIPTIRVAMSGISAVIDSNGRILSSLPFSSRGVIDSHLPKPLNNPTFYSKYKDIPGMVLLAAIWISVWLGKYFYHRRL